MIRWDDEQLAEVGIDKARLNALVRKLTACGREMDELGLTMYGEGGGGNLIHKSRPTHDERDHHDTGSVVANTDAGIWDGGGW